MPTEFSSAVMQKALRERPWIRRVRPDRGPLERYRVTPRTDDHGKYELHVWYTDDRIPVVERCFDIRTGDACLGFHFKAYCYHGAALVIHLLSRSEKRAA